jgi:hypothetical protein
MKLLASALVGLLTLASACDRQEDEPQQNDGVDVCYGGYGFVVQITRGTCPSAATFDKTQIKISSGGAEQFFDLGYATDVDSEVWPPGFQRDAPAQVDVLVYSSTDACRLSGSAAAVVDPEVCATVAVTTTCSCDAP